MNVIVCVDDHMTMLFMKRRQSQDRVLRQQLLDLAGDRPLFLSPYSARQFSHTDPSRLQVSEDFLDQAGPEDWCFVEDRKLLPYLDRIRRLVVCYWNRTYPGDFSLDLDLHTLNIRETREFPGSSHDKITMEVYE